MACRDCKFGNLPLRDLWKAREDDDFPMQCNYYPKPVKTTALNFCGQILLRNPQELIGMHQEIARRRDESKYLYDQIKKKNQELRRFRKKLELKK